MKKQITKFEEKLGIKKEFYVNDEDLANSNNNLYNNNNNN